ncbi:MAG: hypothetical protein LBL91_00575 [Lachnospiraceae bacterium]|jgi:hypothetical protein|nr:hypothetical protein [Lachnospiraceae bacterium]
MPKLSELESYLLKEITLAEATLQELETDVIIAVWVQQDRTAPYFAHVYSFLRPETHQ